MTNEAITEYPSTEDYYLASELRQSKLLNTFKIVGKSGDESIGEISEEELLRCEPGTASYLVLTIPNKMIRLALMPIVEQDGIQGYFAKGVHINEFTQLVGDQFGIPFLPKTVSFFATLIPKLVKIGQFQEEVDRARRYNLKDFVTMVIYSGCYWNERLNIISQKGIHERVRNYILENVVGYDHELTSIFREDEKDDIEIELGRYPLN